jgi:hypothetical protein
MLPTGLLHSVALIRADVSEERIASITKMTRIGELGTTLAISSNLTTMYFSQRASVPS